MAGGQLRRWADQTSAADFDRRYAGDSADFWSARLVALGGIQPDQLILDVGCGTGGHSLRLARRSGSRVIGCDLAERFTAHAAATGADEPHASFLVADALRLPFTDRSADVVVMSLLLHRVPDPAGVITEAFRVLINTGRLLIRTVAPSDAAGSLPYRLFPTMASAQLDRLPPIELMINWCANAGFTRMTVDRVEVERPVNIEAMERQVRGEWPQRYPSMASAELEDGLRRLRTVPQSNGTEVRTATLIAATKPTVTDTGHA